MKGKLAGKAIADALTIRLTDAGNQCSYGAMECRVSTTKLSAGSRIPPGGGERTFSMAEKKADIHITVAEKTLKAAKIKCIQKDTVLSEVITELLAGWVDGRLKIKKA